jgi:hypothetical protein
MYYVVHFIYQVQETNYIQLAFSVFETYCYSVYCTEILYVD